MNDANEIFSTPKVVVVIVNAEDAPEVIGMFHREHAPILYQFHAYGTATSEMLDILGLGGVEKAMIISIAPDYYVKQLMHEILKELELHLHGKGVAFSIPVSGIAGRAMAMLINDIDTNTEHSTENEVSRMKNGIEHDLIIVAAKRGYSEAIVEVAKHVGATGGTVWAAGRIDLEDPIKVLGVTLQSEQEILAMLIKRDKKRDIMMAVNEKFGIESEAQGLILSLPVDSVVGLEKEI